jgi:hypothetical protein
MVKPTNLNLFTRPFNQQNVFLFFFQVFQIGKNYYIQILGSMEDECCFSPFAFYKSKLHSQPRFNGKNVLLTMLDLAQFPIVYMNNGVQNIFGMAWEFYLSRLSTIYFSYAEVGISFAWVMVANVC